MKAEIFEFSIWLDDTDTENLADCLSRVLNESGFTILDFVDHAFSPAGYTALWLLGESHLAVHTFPEESRSYIQLSSCSKEMYDSFITKIKLLIS